MSDVQHLQTASGRTIAYCLENQRALAGAANATVVFLPGFRSNMHGLKAERLSRFCRQHGAAMLRFDYSGHGLSSGRFEDGTLGDWVQDAYDVVSAKSVGSLILVGSSMGAWIMLLLALRLQERIAGLLGIASAPDFSSDSIPHRLTSDQREELKTSGLVRIPSAYDPEPTVITQRLLEEANQHLLLREVIELDAPLRLIHGMQDPDVPWQTSNRLMSCYRGDDVSLHLLKDGDHRLSREEDLQRIELELSSLIRRFE